ncbi:MAG: hypothetical protein P8P74_00335 [Crocinitomicaceae bacterium]|nr:hypothetical protein [Crocinitomicaceae bacterium]
MKSLAIIGMMFCSLGLFAQESSSVDSPKKEKVCAIDRGQAENKTNIKLAPMRHVDARKTSVRCGKAKPVSRAFVKEEKMIVPLTKKNVKVDAKM